MKLSTLLAVEFLLSAPTWISAINVRCQDPTPTFDTFTSSISGLHTPTITASAVVAAYQKAYQLCGPSVDAALQAALQDYNSNFNPEPDTPATSTTDPGFMQWAYIKYEPLVQANDNCVHAKIDSNNLVDAGAADNTLSTGVTTGGGSVAPGTTNLVGSQNPGPEASHTAPVTATSDGSNASASATTSPSKNAAIHLSVPTALLACLVGILTGLN